MKLHKTYKDPENAKIAGGLIEYAVYGMLILTVPLVALFYSFSYYLAIGR